MKRLQEKLGVEADGVFGAATEKALKDYQQKKGLKVDGIAGPDSLASLGLKEMILLTRGSRGNTGQNASSWVHLGSAEPLARQLRERETISARHKVS